MFKKPISNDSRWCIILLEVAIRGWVQWP